MCHALGLRENSECPGRLGTVHISSSVDSGRLLGGLRGFMHNLTSNNNKETCMSALTIADTICFRPYAVNQLSLRSTALNRFHWLLQVTL